MKKTFLVSFVFILSLFIFNCTTTRYLEFDLKPYEITKNNDVLLIEGQEYLISKKNSTVVMVGGKKYPDDDAIERLTNRWVMGKIHSHLSKWYKGNEEMQPPMRDKDNGQLHIAAVAFWIMVMLERDLMDEDYYKKRS